jgi:hypothetical protein
MPTYRRLNRPGRPLIITPIFFLMLFLLMRRTFNILFYCQFCFSIYYFTIMRGTFNAL